MPAERESKSTTPTTALAFLAAMRRAVSIPMRGVKTISATRLVRSIHGLTRNVSATTRTGAPLRGSSSIASDQYGMNPTSHDTPAGRVLLV